jgi:hypothetical protein
MTFEEWLTAYRIDGRKITWTRTYSDVELLKAARDAWDAASAELVAVRKRLAEVEADLETADDTTD